VASEIFADPFIVVQENVEDEHEQRLHAIAECADLTQDFRASGF